MKSWREALPAIDADHFKKGPDQLAAGFEQAKKPSKRRHFLQIVAKPKCAAHGKTKDKPEPKLTLVSLSRFRA